MKIDEKNLEFIMEIDEYKSITLLETHIHPDFDVNRRGAATLFQKI